MHRSPLGARRFEYEQQVSPVAGQDFEPVAVTKLGEGIDLLPLDSLGADGAGGDARERVYRVDDHGRVVARPGADLAQELECGLPVARPLDAVRADGIETVLVVDGEDSGRRACERRLAYPWRPVHEQPHGQYGFPS